MKQIQSGGPPPTISEGAPSPSPVAVHVVMPSQSENSKPQSRACLLQASVEPIVKNLSPPQPQGSNHNEQQHNVSFVEDEVISKDAQVTGNIQKVLEDIEGDERKHFDDRPSDPNLVCLGCRKQFQIGEIQDYRKHDGNCQSRRSGQQSIHMDPAVPIGLAVSTNKHNYLLHVHYK